MTETFALAPSAKNSGLVEFMPGLNMPSEDECKALGKAAETLGIDLIKEPFPGEPEGLCPDVRRDIWRMWLKSNSKVRDSLILRGKNIHKRNFILNTAVSTGIMSLLLAFEYIIPTLIGWDTGLDKLMLLLLTPLLILNGIPLIASICVVDSLICKNLRRIDALIHDDSHMWPHRMVLCLKLAMNKKSSLSLELQALLEFIDEVGPESNWGVVSLEDQIAMSKLSLSLEIHKDRFSKGFVLGLSGENSELVSRACSAVKPGRLEALMDRIERPETQYL